MKKRIHTHILYNYTQTNTHTHTHTHTFTNTKLHADTNTNSHTHTHITIPHSFMLFCVSPEEGLLLQDVTQLLLAVLVQPGEFILGTELGWGRGAEAHLKRGSGEVHLDRERERKKEGGGCGQGVEAGERGREGRKASKNLMHSAERSCHTWLWKIIPDACRAGMEL